MYWLSCIVLVELYCIVGEWQSGHFEGVAPLEEVPELRVVFVLLVQVLEALAVFKLQAILAGQSAHERVEQSLTKIAYLLTDTAYLLTDTA